MVGNLAIEGKPSWNFRFTGIKSENKFIAHLAIVIVSVKEKVFSVGKQSSTKTEQLNAAFFFAICYCDDVLLGNCRLDNLLLFAHSFEGAYLVTKPSRPFEFESFGGLIHLSCEQLYRIGAALFEKVDRSRCRLVVIGSANLVTAGS